MEENVPVVKDDGLGFGDMILCCPCCGTPIIRPWREVAEQVPTTICRECGVTLMMENK